MKQSEPAPTSGLYGDHASAQSATTAPPIDPNDCVDELRGLAHAILRFRDDPDPAFRTVVIRMARRFLALDEHLRAGGQMPSAWWG
jgi:hypothetical protein